MSANFVTGGKEFIWRSVAFARANGESPGARVLTLWHNANADGQPQ